VLLFTLKDNVGRASNLKPCSIKSLAGYDTHFKIKGQEITIKPAPSYASDKQPTV
tara:strand:- start:33 stop:197 length:165 start_codon:yes stop_codon:yes gene_type:complete